MFELLAPLILVGSGFVSMPNSLFEPIRLSEGLEIHAQYLPPGSTIQSEAMALSVEDFAILQAEVESSAGSCDLRISNLKEAHKKSLEEVQQRCAERNATYKSDLEKSLSLNKTLESQLKQSKADLKLQKWVNIGLIVGGSIVTTVVLTR